MSAARDATREARKLFGYGAHAVRRRHAERAKRCVVMMTFEGKGIAWFGASFEEALASARASAATAPANQAAIARGAAGGEAKEQAA